MWQIAMAVWSFVMVVFGALALAFAVWRFAPRLLGEIADDLMAGVMRGWRR